MTTNVPSYYRPCGGCTASHPLRSSPHPRLLANVPQRRSGQPFKLLELNCSRQEYWLNRCCNSGEYSSCSTVASNLFAIVSSEAFFSWSLGCVMCRWTSLRNSAGIWMCLMHNAPPQTSTTISVSGSVAQKSRKVILPFSSPVIMSDTKAGPTSFQSFSPPLVCG